MVTVTVQLVPRPDAHPAAIHFDAPEQILKIAGRYGAAFQPPPALLTPTHVFFSGLQRTMITLSTPTPRWGVV